MRTARQSAVQLLQLMMVASLVLPAILFVYASWLNYRNVEAVSDERIERSLDILHEHALKVFQTVERTFAEVDEVTRGMSDDDIRAAQQRLHLRLKRIIDVMPQLQAILVIGRDGRPLVTSTLEFLAARSQYERARLFQGASRARHGHRCDRRALATDDHGYRRRFLQSHPSPGIGRRLLQRHYRGGGAAELL